MGTLTLYFFKLKTTLNFGLNYFENSLKVRLHIFYLADESVNLLVYIHIHIHTFSKADCIPKHGHILFSLLKA